MAEPQVERRIQTVHANLSQRLCILHSRMTENINRSRNLTTLLGKDEPFYRKSTCLQIFCSTHEARYRNLDARD